MREGLAGQRLRARCCLASAWHAAAELRQRPRAAADGASRHVLERPDAVHQLGHIILQAMPRATKQQERGRRFGGGSGGGGDGGSSSSSRPGCPQTSQRQSRLHRKRSISHTQPQNLPPLPPQRTAAGAGTLPPQSAPIGPVAFCAWADGRPGGRRGEGGAGRQAYRLLEARTGYPICGSTRSDQSAIGLPPDGLVTAAARCRAR